MNKLFTINVILSIWLILSPFILNLSAQAAWNNIIVGFLVLLFTTTLRRRMGLATKNI